MRTCGLELLVSCHALDSNGNTNDDKCALNKTGTDRDMSYGLRAEKRPGIRTFWLAASRFRGFGLRV